MRKSINTVFFRSTAKVIWGLFLFTIVAQLTATAVASEHAVKYVIHISVDGLRADAITTLGPKGAPNFYRLRSEGAFTNNARTDPDFLGTLPNHTSQLTGRGVNGQFGHNNSKNVYPTRGFTLHSNKGSYVASVFDVAHDNGRSTALYTGKDKFQLFKRSYGEKHGALDASGDPASRNKIDRYVNNEKLSGLVDAYISAMRSTPFNYTLLHMRNPDVAGHAEEWDVTPGSHYLSAVIAVDRELGKLIDAVSSSSELADKTVIILTADHGGTYGSTHTLLDSATNYTIPFYVWGRNVPAGKDLYSLNTHTRLNPGIKQVDYDHPEQPIRSSDAPNLALSLLELDSIVGSTINFAQDLNIYPTPRLAGSSKDVVEEYRPLQCKRSKSPLFQAEANELLKLDIIADFNTINKEIYDDEGGDYGIVSYEDAEKGRQYIPVHIKDRGNSRRDFCEWVPLRLSFEDPAIAAELNKEIQGDDRLLKMYKKFKSMRRNVPFTEGFSQKKNIFRSLGDDIKLVTHCGKSTWKWVGGETQKEQEDRLLQEYYLYQVLSQMNSTILKTRLAEVTYRDPRGKELVTRKAFFREPKSKLAKRCGFSKRPYSNVEDMGINDTSWFQLKLYNAFIYFKDYGKDGRNVNMLYAKDGQTFVGPYDFDLSGIIAPGYRPNSNTMEENLEEHFKDWVNHHDGDEMSMVQIYYVVNNRERMRKVLVESLLGEQERTYLLAWFDSYMAELEKYIERNGVLMPELMDALQ
jgi:hypothetical protein